MDDEPIEQEEEEVPVPADDLAAERAEKAESKTVGGNTVIHNAYRGRK